MSGLGLDGLAGPCRQRRCAQLLVLRGGLVKQFGGGVWIGLEQQAAATYLSVTKNFVFKDLIPVVAGIGANDLFDELARASVNVDTIVQINAGEIVFSAPTEDRGDVERTLDSLGAEWSSRDDLGKVSVVGAGMKSHPGVAAKTFDTLHEQGVEPAVVTTSPIKIACHIPADDVEKAVRALHEAFELG